MLIDDLLEAAIERWMVVAGIDLTGGHGVSSSSNYDFGRFTTQLQNARDLDSSSVTAFMMLRGYFELFLKDTQFSAYDLILDPGSVKDQLSPLAELRDLLESPEVVEMIDDFQLQTAQSCRQYGGDEAVSEWIDDKYQLALIRRDALRSIEKLEAHQFAQGQPDDALPKYNLDVWEFWNVNSLIRAARAQRIGGVSLCLIRDPEALFSYFGFAVVNGETVTFLTDRDKGAHPEFKKMTRRPDRRLEERAARNRFPYHLLNLSVSADQKRLYADQRDQLVPIEATAVPLSKISALNPDELIWVAYMFELIRQRYFVDRLVLPNLSYTGEMIREPGALVDPMSALALRGAYKVLEMPKLKREDVTTESTAGQWERAPGLFFDWMVERYSGQVDDNFLNVVGEQEKAALALPAEVNTRNYDLSSRYLGTPYERDMATVDAADFGSVEDLQKDRLWIARRNQMTYIQRLANNEFKETHLVVEEWYKERIGANAEALLNAAARGEMFMTRLKYHGAFTPSRFRVSNVVRQVEAPSWATRGTDDGWGWFAPAVFLASYVHPTATSWRTRSSYHGIVNRRRTREMPLNCYDQPEIKGTIFTYIEPETPTDIATLCGVAFDDLPWQLQHRWNEDWKPYTGNSILNRLDPVDWVLNNPWSALKLGVGMVLSKRAYHARRDALGLERVEWWKEKAT